ncbi:hypothetical protein GGR57DRAFT_471019 [Xylariaceae sp. FL1272]|nr:hypothetical protein GGR57DRAFT_471019 [Xylariaceae sp. FL1272]
MGDSVYLGVWTNWSRGLVLGTTFTTTREYGNLLISFTAIFVGFVAARFWRIICLALHRLYSTSKPQNAIYHQRQVILRNSTSSESGLWSILQLLWAWRASRTGRLASIVPTGLIAAVCLVTFTIAGGFSSTISTAAGDEVLIRSSECGILFPNGTSAYAASAFSYLAEQLNDAVNYAQQCYNTSEATGNSDSTMACSKFAVSNLPTASLDTTASCPFDQKLCRKQDSNIRLDTGYIGNDKLGFNLPNEKGFAWRYVLHCAPLVTEGYETTAISSRGVGRVRYHYGSQTTGPVDNQTSLDYLYEVDDIDTQYQIGESRPSLTGKNFLLDYIIMAVSGGQPNDGSSRFIPELVRLDGDTLIIFLSGNGVTFSQRSDDDWYRANRQYGMLSNTAESGKIPSYIASDAASPLGCVQQWQWCDSSSPVNQSGCTQLGSQSDALDEGFSLFNITEDELAAEPVPSSSDINHARWLWPALMMSTSPISLDALLSFLGAKSLESQTHLLSGVQFSILETQWQTDVTRWWQTILASVQASFVATAQGSKNPAFLQYHTPPRNDAEKHLCDSQKIRSSQYTSFSLLGLLFVFVAGSVIILTSYVIEPILRFLYRYRGYQPYAHFEWISNTDLQLHRLAHEEFGLKVWSDCTAYVPTTTRDALLPSIDFADPTHPMLSRQSPDRSAYRRDEKMGHHIEVTIPRGSHDDAYIVSPVESEDR